MSELILGINYFGHDSSAALMADGRTVFAATEERFSRVKHDWNFPRRAIESALDHVGARVADLDAIAFGFNGPGAYALHRLRSAMTGSVAKSWALQGVRELAKELYHGNGLRALQSSMGPIERRRVYHIDHHEAHAWSSYALSGFDDALVIVIDGGGATQATTIYHGREGRLEPLRVFPWPNSIGWFYAGFTELLGFHQFSDEWKVMGLAAYGEPTKCLSDWIKVGERDYRVDGRIAGTELWDISHLTRQFGGRRNPEEYISQDDKDLAASVQKAAEEAVFAVVREGIRLTGSRNLCLAGGVAMNSKANGKLLASGLIDQVFVQPAATDDGTSIGAALGVYAARGRAVPFSVMRDVYLGPGFSDREIDTALRAYKIQAIQLPEIERVVARLLAEGNIVGWFQGRMEFGPRALGNRSILADARDPRMKDRVNDCIKFRENWRPFAPSCLAERANEYFQPVGPSPFMILTFDVRSEKRDVIPAVTHADNSARVQTVEREVNPRYWDLISEFDKITGVPVIMNTSFNLRDEPIVCTPRDAIRTFYSSGLDFLAIGDYLIAKDPAWYTATVAEPVKASADRSLAGAFAG